MNSVEYLLLSADDGRAKDEVLRALRGRDADGFHRGRQPSLRRVHAVLMSTVARSGIAGQIKGGGDAARSVIAAGGGDVLHSLRAIDLLLQGNGDGALHRLRAGADVERWRRPPVAARGWGTARSAASESPPRRQNNQQSANRGEYRTLNEEVNEHRNPITHGVKNPKALF